MNAPAKLSLFILCSIILSSCGGGKSTSKTEFAINALIAEERALTSNERNLAARICYAYKSKSQNFRASAIGKRFLFETSNTDCSNAKSSSLVESVLQYGSNNELVYYRSSTTPVKFLATVQTDTNGYLAQLCTKISNNQEISNTTTTGNVKVQITFIREELDGFFLQYFVRQADDSYKIDSAEKLKIRTQIDYKTGQILGMDEYYSTQKVCSSLDKAKNSSFEQSFKSN